MMSIHSVGVGKIREHLHGEEFDTGTALGHSAIMSLAFPLIRAIPNIPRMGQGGVESLGTGMKAYWRKYNKINYDDYLSKYGEEATRDTLKVMLRGNRIDLVNQSKLAGFWKVGNKEYSGRDLLNDNEIAKMPIDHVTTLLKRFQRDISDELTKMWGPRYVADLVGSLPRLGIGMAVMNEGLFRTGAFKDMDGEELAAHLFISSVMTKGQGAWGKETSRRYLADYTPYYDALKMLGARPEVLQDRLKFYHGKDNAQFMGSSYATTHAGSKIEEAFDHVLAKGGGPSETFKTSEFDPTNPGHRNVERLGDIYNLMKGHRDPDKPVLDMKRIGKAKLDELASIINKIEIKPGQTIGEMQWPAVQVALTSEPARGIHKTYGAMFNDLNEQLKLPVRYTPPDTEGQYGTIMYRPLTAPSGIRGDIGILMQYNSTLNRLARMGKAIPEDRPLSVKELGDVKELQVRFKEITDRWMDNLDAEYGNRRIYESVDDNQYINFFKRAQTIEAADFMYKVMANDGTSEAASNLRSSMDNIFDVTDTDRRIKYRQSVQDYLPHVEGVLEKPKTEADRNLKNTTAEDLQMLGPMFDLIKTHHAKGVAISPGSQKPISRENLRAAVETFSVEFNKLPEDVRDNFYATGYQEILKRDYAELNLNPRTIHAAKVIREEGAGIWNQRDNRLHMMSNDALQKHADFSRLSESAQKELLKDNNTIRDAFGGPEGGLIVHDNFISVDTKHPDFYHIELSSIKKVAEALKNVEIKDLLNNASTSLEKIRTDHSGLQKKLTEVQNDIMKSVDNITTLGKGDINEINRVARELETLVDMGMSQVDRQVIETSLNKMRKLLSRTSQMNELNIDEYTKHAHSVAETVMEVFRQESNAKEEVAALTNRIINLTTLGKHGGGISPAQTTQLAENLGVKLREIQRGRAGDESRPLLSDLIEQYNDNSSWVRGKEIIEAVNEQAISMVLAHQRNPIFSERAKEIWETSHENQVVDHKSKTLQTIADKYGLQDKKDPNEIDPAFIETVRGVGQSDIRSVQRASDQIKERILEKTDGDNAEFNRRWNEFIRDDAGPLFSSILNGRQRQTASLKAGILEHDMTTKFRTTPNDEFFDRTHIHGKKESLNLNDKYNVTFLDGTITTDLGFGHRVIELDSWPSAKENKAVIQDAIDRAIRTSNLSKDALQRMSEYGHKFSLKDLKAIGNLPMSPYVYMRLSPGTRILFEASKSNIKNLNNDFKSFYEKKLQDLRAAGMDSEATKFETLFGDLVSSADNNMNLHVKMLATHIHQTRQGQFDTWLKEFSKPDMNSEKLSKIEADLYKRGYLSDGGTAQKDHPKLRQWLSENHPDPIVRQQATDIMLRGNKIGTAFIADETFSGKPDPVNRDGTPFDIRRVLVEDLEPRLPMVKENRVLRSVMQRQLEKIQSDDFLPSTKNSLLDGIKFASESYAKYIYAQKGGEGWNGAKTIVFATGDNNMLGKGFLVYVPEISKVMPKGMDLLIGDSSAKSKAGLSRAGTPIESHVMNVPGSRKIGSWIDGIPNIPRKSIMDIDASGVGVQFTSKNVEGVNISSSMFDMQSHDHLSSAREWMGIRRILSGIKKINLFKEHNENNELARLLFSAKEKEGLFYTEGALGLTKKLIQMGMTSSNPFIKPQVSRMIRNDDFSKLKNIPTTYGEEGFIIPDWNGSLKMPVIAELFTPQAYINSEGIFTKKPSGKVDTSPDMSVLHRRSPMQFGEQAVSQHTANRPFMDGVLGHERRTIIARDSNGIDHSIQLVKGQYDFFSPFYETYDPSIHILKNVNGKAENTKQFQKNMKASSQFQKEVSYLIQKLFKKSQEHQFSFEEAHDYLSGRTVSREGWTSIRLTAADKALADKYQLALGFSNNSIPKVGKDQPLMRVKRINGKDMNGLTQVNNYDLRVTLQRDNDGDHLYTYMDVPHDMLKDYMRDMGHIEDYPMMSKIITRDDINIFGIGRDGKAAQVEDQIGFSDYAMQINAQRKAIGKIISTRRVLHWMNDSNLKFDNESFVRDFTRKTDAIDPIVGKNQQPIERMSIVNQNAVDVFPGPSRVTSPEAIEHFFIHGELPAGFSPEVGSLEHRLANGASFFTKSDYGKGPLKEVQLEIFRIISNTMKKANSISNDVWDEAGSRAPEPFELKRDYNNLKRLHNDPDGYIVRRLLRKINGLKRSNDPSVRDRGEVLLDQTIEMFYQDQLQGATYGEKIAKFRKDLLKGTVMRPTIGRFRFDTKGDTPTKRLDNFFDGTMGSHVLHDLVNSKAYWQEDAGDLNTRYHKEAGLNLDTVIERIMFTRALGLDPVKDYKNFRLPEFVVDKEDASGQTVRKSITRGVARTIAQKEYRNLAQQLEHFRGENFVNQDKLDRIESRMNTTGQLIDILDKKAASDMVISKDGQVTINKNMQKASNPKRKKFNSSTFVYELRGPISPKNKKWGDEDLTIADLSWGKNQDVDIDYGHLKKIGWFNKGDTMKLLPGRVYVFDKKPMLRQSMAKDEARYGEAWKEVTGVGRMTSEHLISDPILRDTFVQETLDLRQSMDRSYRKTLGTIKRDPTHKGDVFKHTSARDMDSLQRYFDTWVSNVEGVQSRSEAVQTLMKYLIQPQVQTGRWLFNGTDDVPYYRQNRNLTSKVLNWALEHNNGFSKTALERSIKRMVKDVEKIADGRRYQVDETMEGYKTMYRDGFDWSAFGKRADLAKSLLGSFWFDTPTLPMLPGYHNFNIASFGKPRTAKTVSGQKTIVKQRIPKEITIDGCL